MFISLKYKILVLFSLLVVGILGAILIVVSQIDQLRSKAEIKTNLKRTKLNFERLLSDRNRQLATSAKLLSFDFAFKQAVATAEPKTVLSAARNQQARIGSDLFIVTDSDGIVLADTNDWNRFGDDISAEPWIEVPLYGEEYTSLIIIDGSLYQVISFPLLAPDVIGTLSLGFRIDDSVAIHLQEITPTEISFLVGNRVVASTLKGDVRQDLERQLATLDLREIESGDLFQLNLATGGKREQFLSILGSISSNASDSERMPSESRGGREGADASEMLRAFGDGEKESEATNRAEISDTSEMLRAFGSDDDSVDDKTASSDTSGVVFSKANLKRLKEQLLKVRFDPSVEINDLARPQSLQAGRRTLLEKCTLCHDMQSILAQPRTPSGWHAVVQHMTKEAAAKSLEFWNTITQREEALVTAYLVSLTLDPQRVAEVKRRLRGLVGNDNEADDTEASDESDMLRAFSRAESESHAADEAEGFDASEILSAFDDAADKSEASDGGEILEDSKPHQEIGEAESVPVVSAESEDSSVGVGASPSYLIQGSLDKALAPLRKTQRDLLVIGIVAIAIGIGLSLVIATGVTSAMRQLVKGTAEVIRGNYGYQLNITQRDEIGQLANHFNAMVAGLRDKERIRALMDKVVSKEIAEELLKGEVKLGGETRPCTMLFSDVRGWTTISEKLDPEALVEMLNSYLSLMSDAIENHKGVIDKYIGDAIVALFGAPISYQDDIRRSVDAALEMRRRLAILNAEREKNGEFPLEVGIGLNSGLVLAGNIGSEARLNYTVMGDSVNLAARLEGLTKLYGAGIIAPDVICEKLGSDYLYRELDLIQVKGKTKSVRIFEVLESGKSEKLSQTVEVFESGLAYYRQQDWGRAEEAFTQTLGGFQNNLASELYLERIQNYRKSPPPRNWDGVFVATEKYDDYE